MVSGGQTSRRTWAAVLLILLWAAGAAAQGKRIEQKSFDVSRGGTLTIDADLGSIEVQAAPRDRVEIEVYAGADARDRDEEERMLRDLKIDIEQNGSDVRVVADYRGRRGWSNWWRGGRRLRVRFLVTVPQQYNLNLKTSGGGISVDDLEGEVVCRTSGGSLDFGNIKGPIRGKTSGGSISVGRVDGDVDVHTSGGSIRIDRAGGEVQARTSGGSIRVEEVYGRITASTSGGSVSAKISEQPKADCRLTTSGGNVTVYLKKDIAVLVNASTSGGRVHTDFPVTIRGEISKRSLRAEINGGGPELYLRTSGGSISIKEL